MELVAVQAVVVVVLACPGVIGVLVRVAWAEDRWHHKASLAHVSLGEEAGEVVVVAEVTEAEEAGGMVLVESDPKPLTSSPARRTRRVLRTRWPSLGSRLKVSARAHAHTSHAKAD